MAYTILYVLHEKSRRVQQSYFVVNIPFIRNLLHFLVIVGRVTGNTLGPIYFS